MNIPENFKYLLEFLNYIIKNKDYIKNDKELCKLISSILPLILYLCTSYSNLLNYFYYCIKVNLSYKRI